MKQIKARSIVQKRGTKYIVHETPLTTNCHSSDTCSIGFVHYNGEPYNIYALILRLQGRLLLSISGENELSQRHL